MLMTFKKGEVANPKGRPKVPEEIRMMKKFNREWVEVHITEMLKKSVTEIEEILKNKDHMSIDHFIARIILMGIIKGDSMRLNFLFDRVIGKVTNVEEIKISKPFMIESLDGNKTITLGTDEVRET